MLYPLERHVIYRYRRGFSLETCYDYLYSLRLLSTADGGKVVGVAVAVATYVDVRSMVYRPFLANGCLVINMPKKRG